MLILTRMGWTGWLDRAGTTLRGEDKPKMIAFALSCFVGHI